MSRSLNSLLTRANYSTSLQYLKKHYLLKNTMSQLKRHPYVFTRECLYFDFINSNQCKFYFAPQEELPASAIKASFSSSGQTFDL